MPVLGVVEAAATARQNFVAMSPLSCAQITLATVATRSCLGLEDKHNTATLSCLEGSRDPSSLRSSELPREAVTHCSRHTVTEHGLLE